MLLWLGVFLLAFVAEALSDSLAVFYQTSVRKLWKRKAMLWGVCLGVLGWVDIAGLFAGLPMTAIIAGSLVGGAVGSILPFVIMLGILFIRPTGMFGWKTIERV